MSRTLHLSTLLASTLLTFAASAQVTLPSTRRPPAQPTTTEPSKPEATPVDPGKLTPVTATVPLSDQSIDIETVGLTMQVPAGCVAVQGTGGPDAPAYTIVPENQKWMINIQVRQTGRAETSIAEITDGILDNLKRISPEINLRTKELMNGSIEVLQHTADLRIAGCQSAGARLYAAVANPGKGRQVRGYSVFKPLPTTFVVFELVAPEELLDSARSMYEVSIATATFVDPTKSIEARSKALVAGQEFISNLGEDKLAKLADEKEHWYRLYRPGAGTGDAAEIGYRVQKIWRGRRGDLGSDVSAGRDNPEGFLVSTRGRVINKAVASTGKVNTIIDTESVAFISLDRKEEAWVTKTAVREGEKAKPQIASETGARSGTSMSIMQQVSTKPATALRPLLQGTNYLSQAEVQLIGPLMALEGKNVELGFYAYRPENASVSLRRDALTRDAERAGVITVSTRNRDDKAVTRSNYRDDGSLIRTTLPDGSTWEPVNPDELLSLWRSKGLPIGK